MDAWQTHFTEEQKELIAASEKYRQSPHTVSALDLFIIIAKLASLLQDDVVPTGRLPVPPVAEYILTTDDDGHYYVVALSDFYEFSERVARERDFDDLDVTRVGGSPSLVKFSEWRIG